MSHAFSFEMSEVADATDSRLALPPGSSVFAEGVERWRRLLETVANMLVPGLVVALVLRFDPQDDGNKSQTRLSFELVGEAPDEHSQKVFTEHVESVFIQALFPLRGNRHARRRAQALCRRARKRGHRCYIVREVQLPPSGARPTENAEAPPHYYIPHPLEPNETPSVHALEAGFANLSSPFEIRTYIQATLGQQPVADLARLQHKLKDLGRGSRGGSGRHRGAGNRDIVEPNREPDPVAATRFRPLDDVAQAINTNTSLLRFVTVVHAGSAHTARTVAEQFGGWAFTGGWRTWTPDEQFQPPQGCQGFADHWQQLHTALHQQLPAACQDLYRGLAPLRCLATPDELQGAFCLPLAAGQAPLTIRRTMDPPPSSPETHLCLGRQQLGAAAGAPSAGPTRGTLYPVLSSHTAIFARSGYGKTHLLLTHGVELNRHGDMVPIIHIEPAKKDASSIKNLTNHPDRHVRDMAQRFRVYTLGDDDVSPLRFNLCHGFPGENVDQVLGDLRLVFQSAHSTSSILTLLFDEVVEMALLKAWREGRQLTLAELEQFVDPVVRAKGHSAETQAEFSAALKSRIRGWQGTEGGSVWQCAEHCPSMESFLSNFTLIQTGGASPEVATVYTLAFLLKFRRYIELNPLPPRSDGKPNVMIEIDEAHTIVPPVDRAGPSDSNADPTAAASEIIQQCLTELRSLGVAVVIADQHPSNVDETVLAAPSTYWIGSQAHANDRKALEAAAGLNPEQVAALPRLEVGEAYFRSRGYAEAVPIQTFDFTAGHGTGKPPGGPELLAQIKQESWFVNELQHRAKLELFKLSDELERLNTFREEVLQTIRKLEHLRQRADRAADTKTQHQALDRVAASASKAKQKLSQKIDFFRRMFYSRLIGAEAHVDCLDPTLRELRQHLVHAIENESAPLSNDPLIRRLEALAQ